MGLLGVCFQHLLKNRYKVLGLSRNMKCNIHDQNFKYISIDLTNCVEIEKVFLEYDISAVVHLAAIAHGKMNSKLDWNLYYRVNTLVSKTIFKCAAKAKAAIVFTSTVDVYGPIKEEVITEDLPINPVTDYGRSKYLAECWLRDVAEKNRIDYVILRLAPVYAKEFMSDVYKRIYLKYPQLGFVIGKGIKYQFVSVNNVIDFIILWLESERKVTDIVNIRDINPIDSEELIYFEKKTGNMKIVIRIPQQLISYLTIGLNIICAITRNSRLIKLRTILYKLISPPNYSIARMKKQFLPKWNLINTVYDSYNN